jgi:hypothetical protein
MIADYGNFTFNIMQSFCMFESQSLHLMRITMRNLLILALAAAFVVSCSSNDPVSPSEPSIKIPGKGSTFEIAGYQLDSINAKIANSDFTAVQTTANIGQSFGDKTGVWSTILTDKVTGEVIDTTYMCLDEKKDLLLWTPELGADGSSRWLRLPVTSGLVFVDSVVTSGDFGGIPIEFAISVRAERSGNESIVVAGTSIATKKIALRFTIRISALGQVIDTATFNETQWFAPSLGMFIQRSTGAYSLAGEWNAGNYFKLTKYTLK